jgi:hypothetical protein
MFGDTLTLFEVLDWASSEVLDVAVGGVRIVRGS